MHNKTNQTIKGAEFALADEYFDTDGIYEIKDTAFDVAGNSSGEKIYTYVVMRKTAMMAYIPENTLNKFNNVGIRAIDFSDIPIYVYAANDLDFSIKIGETLLEAGDYNLLGEKDLVNRVKEYLISIPSTYIASMFSDDNQVYDMPINVLNADGEILTLGRIVIDNVKPFGEFESGFTDGKGYYGIDSKEIEIIRLSDDIDKNKTVINVDGTDIKFNYDDISQKISFTLDKSEAYGHPWAGHNVKVKLVDTAGNELSLSEINNVYVGNWFLRYWIFFVAGGGIIVIAVTVLLWKRLRKKESD